VPHGDDVVFSTDATGRPAIELAGHDPVFGAGLLNALGARESVNGRAAVAKVR